MKRRLYAEAKYGDSGGNSKKKYLEGKAKQMGNDMTSPEIAVNAILLKIGIIYQKQFILNSVIYDFYVPSKNLLIEVDGDYYHANPLIYEQKDLNGMQKKNVIKDKFKTSLAIGLGYDLIRIWENDIKKNIQEVEEKLKLKLT